MGDGNISFSAVRQENNAKHRLAMIGSSTDVQLAAHQMLR
jgi:hypothetical protein